MCVCVHLREGVCEHTQKCLCEHFQGSVHACMPNDIKEGRQPWVLPCAQNHLTQADASLKHCHTRWPAEKPGKSLIVPHISIVFCLYFFLYFFLLPHLSEAVPNSTKTRKCEEVGASRREGHFFSIFLFSQYFSRGAA